MGTQRQGLSCRRRGLRLPFPLEVQLTTNDCNVKAIIRDVSFAEDIHDESIGIGLLHSQALPLNQVLDVHALSESSLITRQSQCTLMWTRDFGADGYLSGGRLTAPPETGADRDGSREAP